MATPITVNLTDAGKAWKEIQNAIRKTLKINDATLQSQAQQDLQMQASAVNDGTVLEMTSSQLNGPVTGYQIPTTAELFGPLRTIMQQPGNFPCGSSNPFAGEAYIAPPASSPPSSPPLDPQFCYVIQRLMYLVLKPVFDKTLKPYHNYDNPMLEDEALGQLEKAIVSNIDNNLNTTDMLTALNNAMVVQNTPSSPPSTLLIQPALSSTLSAQVKAWLQQTSNDTVIDGIAEQYVAALTDDDSTVFPPAAGETFLENLSTLLYSNINTELRKTNGGNSQSSTSSDADSSSKTDLQTTLLIQPNVQAGINDTIMQQLAGVGQQGMLLADVYDLETALGFQQYTTAVINSLPGYLANLNSASTTATQLAQTFNAVALVIDNFAGTWLVAEDIVNQNAQLSAGSQSGSNINIQLQQAYNGTKSPYTVDYLNSISSKQESQGILVNVEDYFTNITVQLAGLNYFGQSALVQQPTQTEVNTLVSSISDQVASDIAAIQQSLKDYATNLKNWVSTNEVVTSNALTLEQMNEVSPSIQSLVKNTTPQV